MRIFINTSFKYKFQWLPYCYCKWGAFWFDWGWTFFSIARRPKGFQFKISIDNEAPEKES
jgi:hypothetical protein